MNGTLRLLVSVVMFVLAPGLDCYQAFGQVLGTKPAVAAPPTARIQVQSGGAPALPVALHPVPSALPLAVPAPVVAASAVRSPGESAHQALGVMAEAAAPALRVAADPKSGDGASAAAAEQAFGVLLGRKTAGVIDATPLPVASEMASAESGATLLRAAHARTTNDPAPLARKLAEAGLKDVALTVDSSASYGLHRFFLKSVAALTGAVYSLPSAGPALTQKLIAQAADRRVVLSDYDDTLASYNQVLPQDMVSAIQAVKAAGKEFVVISDRGDEKRAHQLTVFESIASLPASTRAGMYVAANSGGRVYRYDEKGEPVRVFEVPGLDEVSKAHVALAAESTKARLVEVGAEQHVADGKNPAESWGTYGYALMLKIGSSEAQVRGAAAILEQELSRHGLHVEVNPRFAKDPANPPYINFSIVTKESSARYIAQILDAEAKDVLVIGDSMYAPHEAKKSSWLTRLAERVSGREIPQTGNATDRNMEKALPGALTLGVGATGDPRASNLWVLDGKGPSLTRRVLMSVASRPRPAAPKVTDDQVRAAAASVVMSKGMPWSKTEYYMNYSMALENLKKDDATDAQIELFKKLCAEAPIRGGRFNPWSGD